MTDRDEPPRNDDPLERAMSLYENAWADGVRTDPDKFCRDHAECGPELRRQLDRFLFVADELKSGAAKSRSSPGPTRIKTQEAKPGKRLGDFELIREMGRGGMGVVYEARQVSLGRRVALKVLEAHLTLREETVERFKREASTASRLRHPGIVEIHSIGEKEGTHFFAMEFVDGTPLDRLIGGLRERKEAPPKARTTREKSHFESVCRLTAQVAEALDHAHRAGVIHRDIKPSNILIRSDGSAVLTDFGLARDEGFPSLTMTGEFAGTPHYVSPEQAQARQKKVGHRADIYSLGVTLYELLTLKRPFDGKTSQEVLQKIISKDPKPPRDVNPLVPRDLETICLTAMEKNPDRRYRTAREFADDIERFLNFETIQARPVGIAVRTYRLVRRNPACSALVSFACLVAFAGPLIFGIQQQAAKNLISEALLQSEREADRARLEADKLRRVCECMIDIFKLPRPNNARKMATAFELLKEGEAILDDHLADQPEIQIPIKAVIARSLVGLGLYDEAEPLIKYVNEQQHQRYGEYHPMAIESELNLACLYAHLDQTNDAEHLFKINLAKSRDILGPEHEQTLQAMKAFASFFLKQGRQEDAMELLENAYRIQCRRFGIDHLETLNTTARLARAHKNNNEFEKAEAFAWQVIRGRERLLGMDHPDTLKSLRNLTQIYVDLYHFDRHEYLYQESYDRHCTVFGKDHPFTLKALIHLAFYYFERKTPEEAEPLYERFVDGSRRALGPDHPQSILSLTYLAALRDLQERTEEAEKLHLQALEEWERVFGHNHKGSWIILSRLVDFYIAHDRSDEVEPYLRKIMEIMPKHRRPFGKYAKMLDDLLDAKIDTQPSGPTAE